MIRAILTFTIVSVVLLILAGLVGWIGAGEMLVVLASAVIITLTVIHLRKRKMHVA